MEKPFNSEEKIRILLYEYAALRNEIISRTNNMYQLIAVSAALFVWILGRPLGWSFWLGVAITSAIVSILGWFICRDINKASKRLRELESDINCRAGEELLIWETRWGGAVTGYWGRAKPLPPKSGQRSDVEKPDGPHSVSNRNPQS